MKAYSAESKYGDEPTVVFAENANKARQAASYTEELCDEPYTQIRVRRMPKLDGMEDRKPKNHPWLNDEIKLILVRDYGWACIDPTGDDCDGCCARQYCY